MFPKDHLVELVGICEKHKIPIIADEIYEEMAFAPLETVSLASIEGQVPILQVGGLAKRWMAPGWRIGWICIHDRYVCKPN